MQQCAEREQDVPPAHGSSTERKWNRYWRMGKATRMPNQLQPGEVVVTANLKGGYILFLIC